MSTLATVLNTARPVERMGYAVGALLMAAGALHFGVFLVDGGPWQGPVSWRKPTTFGLSFGLTLISVTWVTRYLRVGEQTRRLLLRVFAADCVVEVGAITLQAWRGVPSHFNRETAFDSVVTVVLAIGGVVLVLVLTAFAVRAFRGNPELPASMQLAQRAGWATLLVALASGAAMIARGVVESNTTGQEAGYAAGGFLKPVHGVSMHGVLVLPLLAWLLSRTPWPERRRVRVVSWSAAAYAVAVAVALALSVAGQVN